MMKERLKGVLIGALATLMLVLSFPAFAGAVTSTIQVTFRNIGVSVDGRTIVTEQEPFIFEGRTYLAVRDVAEAFGAEIRMNEITDTVEIVSQRTGQTFEPQGQTQTTTSVSSTNRAQRPSNPSISREQAEQIALSWLNRNRITDAWRDGGISMDFERSRWVWELEYENKTHEWDFYIDVETGEVIHVDIDHD